MDKIKNKKSALQKTGDQPKQSQNPVLRHSRLSGPDKPSQQYKPETVTRKSVQASRETCRTAMSFPSPWPGCHPHYRKILFHKERLHPTLKHQEFPET